MEALATVVFERTLRGAERVNASIDTLPRALRSVLLAVDGCSSVAGYELLLPALMPLAEKFAALEQLGLLRRKGSITDSPVVLTSPSLAPAIAAAGLPRAVSTETVPDFELELRALSRQMGLVPDNAVRVAIQSTSPGLLNDMEPLVDAASSAASTPAMAESPELPAVARASATLKELLAEMEAFLSQAIGLDGLPVAIMVAQISSIEQLRLALPSYIELMRSYGLGAQTEAHISSLESQLARCR